jgi:hypothetical protein
VGADFFRLNPKIYIISRIASVLSKNRATNHHSCLFPPARHRATPFHGRVQRMIKGITHVIQSHELNGSIFTSPLVDRFQSTYYHSVPVFEFWMLSVRNEGFQLLNTILEFALGYKVVGRDIFALYFLQIFVVYGDVL